MNPRGPRMNVLLAMSGGVDSSVAAAMLVEQGHNVVGVTMKTFCYSETNSTGKTCCGLDGILDLGVRRRTHPLVAAGIAAITLVWAATIAPRVIGKVPFGAMFAEFEMANAGIEESREMYGLLIITLWMTAVAIAAWRRRS